MLEDYGATRKLPMELRGRLRKHFEFQYQKTQEARSYTRPLLRAVSDT